MYYSYFIFFLKLSPGHKLYCKSLIMDQSKTKFPSKKDPNAESSLKKILEKLSEAQYAQALNPSTLYFTNSKRNFFELIEKDNNSLLSYLSDGLLHVKILLKSDNSELARETLVILLRSFTKYFREEEFENFNQNTNNGIDYAKIEKKEKIKPVTNILGCFAAFFAALGDFKNSEKCYIIYIKLIEKKIGEKSVDNANCYFLMGLFYYEFVIYFIN